MRLIQILLITLIFTSFANVNVKNILPSLENNESNLKMVNDNFHDIEINKQNKLYDTYTATPTVNDIQNSSLMMFYSDDTGRLIYKVNNHVYSVQGILVE